MGLADVGRVVDDERVPVDEPDGVGLNRVPDLLVKSLGLQFTVLSFLLFGYATGYYTRSDGETDSVFASVRVRRFQARGGGSPASEERKFAGV